MKNLRLLLFSDCNRKCKLCCNKGFDLESLPKCKSFDEYNKIILTGGEPLLHPNIVISTIQNIRRYNQSAKIIVYTANTEKQHSLKTIISMSDGITLTLHTKKDINSYNEFIDYIYFKNFVDIFKQKSMRLNIFRGIALKSLIGLDL